MYAEMLYREYGNFNEVYRGNKRPDAILMLEAIGIEIKDLELMDEREIYIVFQNAGLNPEDFEI